MATQSKKFIRLFVKGNQELAKKHKVDVCPHLVFLDPKGAETKILLKRDLIQMTAPELRTKLGEILGEKSAPGDTGKKAMEATRRNFLGLLARGL